MSVHIDEVGDNNEAVSTEFIGELLAAVGEKMGACTTAANGLLPEGEFDAMMLD